MSTRAFPPPAGAPAEVGRLIKRLQQAEAALARSLGPGADAVIDSTGHAHLLRQAQRALQASERRFRALFEHSADVVALLGPEGEILYDSPAIKRVLGYDQLELAGRSVFEFVHPDDLPAARTALAALRRGPHAGVSLALRCRHRDGRFVWLEGTATNLLEEEAVSAIVVNYRDITPRHEMEERLRRSETNLAEAQSIARVGSWELDLENLQDVDANLLWWSDELFRLFGHEPGAIAVTNENFFAAVHPEDRASIRAAVVETLRTGATYQIDHRIILPDGSIRYIHERADLVRDPVTGRPLRMVGTAQDVTDRKRTELALAESERRYRELIQSLPAAVYTCDAEGVIGLYNEAAVNLWGRRPDLANDRWCGSHRMYLADGSELTREDCFMARSIGEGRSFRGTEVVIERPDGSRRHVLPHPDPIRDADGRVVGAVNMLVDVTEMREAERLQREHAGFIADVLDSLTNQVAVLDEEGRIIEVNEAWRSFGRENGADPDSYLGANYLEVCRRAVGKAKDQCAEDVGRALGEILAGRRDSFALEYPCFGPQRPRWFVLRAARLKGARRGAVVSHQDTTERVLAEQALRESEQRFRQLAESIDQVFWLSSPDKEELHYASPAYERIWGRSRESLYARPSDWHQAIVPEDRERVIRAALARQIDGTYDEEYRITQPDGTMRWIRDRAFPVHDEAGRVIRIAGLAEDITEQRRLEGQFLRTQRLESIGTLAGGIAHDLNNVLAPILMSSQLLRRGVPPDRQETLVQTIESSARRGADMVRQVLMFARGIEGERIQLEPRQLLQDIQSIIDETFPKSIRLEIWVAPDARAVTGDRTQLQQVLLNLSVNARDAMPQGGRLAISVENAEVDDQFAAMTAGASPGPHVLFKVSDTGGGIPPGLIDRIFEPFFTTKEQGKGTGLGLSTVQAIVKSHGGFVHVLSDPGRGATFEVYLPAAAARTDEGPTAPAPAPELPRGRGELVLVADDEELVRATTQATLEAFGYRVVTAKDGAEAVAVFAQHRADVAAVLTDMMMPVMDGPSLINAIHHLRPGIPVIVASGLGSQPPTGRAMPEAVRHFLHKPYAAETLLRVLNELLHPPA